MQLGVERLISDSSLQAKLQNRRVALLGHPASVDQDLSHSLDTLLGAGVPIVAAFGPQHGMRGEAQDNMVETADYRDPEHNIPVSSLYGDSRRLTSEMLEHFDVLLVDLQDLVCRIYTFITTMFWALEECGKHGKTLWVLDRPNPAGRGVEGGRLQPGFESFVGAANLPMRHGLSMGELARWYVATHKLDVDFEVIEMQGWSPNAGPGFGWPSDRAWVNPSPNAANVMMARAYPGTVIFEGTTLSEGRGTTRPLEVFGAPGLDMQAILQSMYSEASAWLQGCVLRPCWFEPTFHKHVGQLCAGLQIHTDTPSYDPKRHQPYRTVALFLRTVRRMSDIEIWRDFHYEYETDRLAVDLIDGSSRLRTWVDDPKSEVGDFDAIIAPEETAWLEERQPYLLYD